MSGSDVSAATTDALRRRVELAGHLPIAVDAMGGDNAPHAIVDGARQAFEEDGIPLVLFGRPDELGDVGDVPVVAASEVIAMDAEPGASVRRMKDSSLVRAAEAVRDGHAIAMMSAGNTGAAMAASLLRMGRIRGIARPAIATPVVSPGGLPTLLVDVGANAECQPEWMVQFGQMGVVQSRIRYGIAEPRVGLMSIGEESVKGNQLIKDTHELMIRPGWLDAVGGRFIGNVEGRDVMSPDVDVIVCDGFVGNVILKTLEGALPGILTEVRVRAGTDPAVQRAIDKAHAELNPENTGGAILLGVKGVATIAHGSSSAWAIRNGLRITQEMIRAEVVAILTRTVGREGADPKSSHG